MMLSILQLQFDLHYSLTHTQIFLISSRSEKLPIAMKSIPNALMIMQFEKAIKMNRRNVITK